MGRLSILEENYQRLEAELWDLINLDLEEHYPHNPERQARKQQLNHRLHQIIDKKYQLYQELLHG